MSTLRINLLGSFELLTADGRLLPLPGRTMKLLLAYVAVAPARSVARAALAALLWGERGEEQARGSLRQALLTLRKALGEWGEAAFTANRDELRLDPALVTVDLQEIERLAGQESPEALEQAAALCRGEFLAGVEAATEEAEDWLRLQRQAVLDLTRRVLLRLARLQRERGRSAEAEAAARRLLALDPSDEEAHRLLIALHAAAGDWGRAARQYEVCARVLKTTLGVPPSPETRALYDQALKRQAAAPADSPRPHVIEGTAFAGRPSVAVLPFDNLSGETERDYLADGMAEELITELSRLPELVVIARQSSFAYKGRPQPPERIAAELGVRYLVGGALRLSGERIRITAQLTDAESGRTLWSERYDRVLADLFTLQEEIAREITVALQVALTEGEAARRWHAGTRDLEAWRLYTRALGEIRRYTQASYRAAGRLAEQATERDPNYALAWALLAEVRLTEIWDGYVPAEARRSMLAASEAAIARAFALAPDLPEAWVTQSEVLLVERRHGPALAAAERAVAAAPNDANAQLMRAICLICDGDARRGLAGVQAALRLSPFHSPSYRHWLVRGLIGLGRSAEALRAAEECVAEWPDYASGHITRVWAAVEAGDMAQAEQAARDLLAASPAFSVAANAVVELYRDPAMTARQRQALLKAGLPA